MSPNFDALTPGGLDDRRPVPHRAGRRSSSSPFVVYFALVKPYEAVSAKMKKDEAPVEVELGPSTEDLLIEIRDLLAKQKA